MVKKEEYDEVEDLDFEDVEEDTQQPDVEEPQTYEDEDLDDFDDSVNDFDDIGGVPPMEKHNDLLKELTNFAPYLKDTVNGWLGLTWDEIQGKYVQSEYVNPIMNRNCAAWCVSLLKTYARGNNIITDMHSEDYKNMMSDIIENVWLNVGTRSDQDFGIKQDGDVLRICNEVEHAAGLVLMGAGDGRYNKFLAGTMQTNYRGDSGGMGFQGNPMQGMNQNNIPQQGMSSFQKMKKAFLG